MPVVVRNTLSQAPFCTTLVSPVTICTPASRAVSAIDLAIRRRSSSSTPSSMMAAQER